MDNNRRITAKLHAADFSKSDSNFASLSVLEDGDVYYTLCSHDLNTQARIYKYDPSADDPTLFADYGQIS